MPTTRPLVRALAAIGIVLAGSAAESLVVPAPARADFATDCSSPTRTLTGDRKDAFSVQPGETLLLTGGKFSGGVDTFPAGSTLCVSPSANLTPAYLNNAAGTLVVAAGGEVTLKGVALATGFALENEGSVEASNLNVNGAATIYNAAGAVFEVDGSFSPASGSLVNDGVMRFNGSTNLNGPVTLENSRLVVVHGTATLDGSIDNTGIVRITGKLTVNGSGTLVNECGLLVEGVLANNGPDSTNLGITLVGDAFTNNGRWEQTETGLLRADSLTDDGQVVGLGGYRFAGSTSVQGSFVGSSAADPIVVQDLTPPAPPQVFDVQSGTVANTVVGTIPEPRPGVYPLPGCSTTDGDGGADVETAKTAPAQVDPGAPLTFTVTVTNHGPDPADDVVVADDLPPELLGPVTASDGGVVAGGSVTWDLGTIAVDETRQLTVTGTAPASGTLVNTVSSTSSTTDPAPSDNDGSAPGATTTTDVAPPPVNNPPVAADLDADTVSRQPVVDRVQGTDPDAGQTLSYSITTRPASGRAVVFSGGGFAYLPDTGFTGRDSFTYTVCDNGTPVLCATGTVTVTVRPVARDDTAETPAGQPVSIPVLANDTGTAPVVSTSGGPTNGEVAVEPDGSITYTPDAGFVGTDTFDYTICSPTSPDVCATATVTVTVLPPNNPPVLPGQQRDTTVGKAVSGRAHGTDPDDDALTYRAAAGPRHGRAVVRSGGGYVYRPAPRYAGHDAFLVSVCDDGDPVLCATGRIRVDVHPVARFDRATTTEGTKVRIRVLANDLGRHRRPELVSYPRHGNAVRRGSVFAYWPDGGFTGRDSFRYRLCTPGARPLCDAARVLVVVRPGPPDGGHGGGGLPS